MTENPRPFVIPLRRRWGLLILPVICLLYFLAVVALVLLEVELTTQATEYVVLGGAGLFALTFLVELPFFLRRRRRRAMPEAAPEPAAMDLQDEPPEPFGDSLAPALRPRADDEVVTTTEQQQGMRVVEYSRPAKSRNRGSVYAKTYVPVAKDVVLRVETLAAEPRDL